MLKRHLPLKNNSFFPCVITKRLLYLQCHNVSRSFYD
nr:MAG TPA: hypothetical protein [Caudoviricetes sp.]